MTENQIVNIARNATKVAIRSNKDFSKQEIHDEVMSMLLSRVPDTVPAEDLHDVVAEAVDEIY